MQILSLLIYFREGAHLRPIWNTLETQEKSIEGSLFAHYPTLREQVIAYYSPNQIPNISKEEIFFAPSEKDAITLLAYLEAMNSPKKIRSQLQYKMLRQCDYAIPVWSENGKLDYKIYKSKNLIASAPKTSSKLKITGFVSLL